MYDQNGQQREDNVETEITESSVGVAGPDHSIRIPIPENDVLLEDGLVLVFLGVFRGTVRHLFRRSLISSGDRYIRQFV